MNKTKVASALITLSFAILFFLTPLFKEAAFAQDKSFSPPTNLELVEFNSASFPATIKYPKNWFTKEEEDRANNIYVAYLSKEQSKKAEDIIQVGATIVYFKKYPNLETMTWDEFIQSAVDSAKLDGYSVDDVFTDNEKYAYPAFTLITKNQKIRMSILTIKINQDILHLIFEAPLAEYGQYEKTFADMLSSLTIKK